MPQPIPSYLLAIAAGDLVFEPISGRSGVWAEPTMVNKAAKEFEDTEKMIGAAEKLYGEYRWGRYDMLVLPPSFPFGGMENPRLTLPPRRDRRRQVAGLAGRPRTGAQLVGQPGDQRQLEGHLAQ
uniref:Amidase domain-containing protein n=1 Tax=Panagrolaimus superbus TaxID=310955 RepID=A0A914Z5A9_9BILA